MLWHAVGGILVVKLWLVVSFLFRYVERIIEVVSRYIVVFHGAAGGLLCSH